MRQPNNDFPVYGVAIFLHDKDHPNGTMQNLNTLSEAEYEEFSQSSVKIIKWLKEDFESFAMLEYSYERFKNTVSNVRTRFITPTLPKVDDALVLINADFFSFLGLMELYLDHTAKRIGSKNKSVLDVFNKAASDEFDKHFSYRFFCQLDNYAKHITMPIKGLNGSNQLDRTGNKVINKFGIYFIRKELLSHEYNWTRKVLPDLQVQPEHIEVLPHAEKVMNSMRRIHVAAIRSYIPVIKGDVALIKKLASYVDNKKERPFVAKVMGMDADMKADISMTEIPIEYIRHAEDIADEYKHI